MFDSKYTDYKITDPQSLFSSNPRSNVVKEVFTAFRKNGISIGAYFSKPDWHSTDYWWPYFPPTDRNVNYDPKKYPERWKSFQNFTYNQVEELMKNYGAIDLLWLDGGWVRPAESLTDESRPWLGAKQYVQDVNIPRIAAMARKNQPGLLIVDRSVHNEYENYRTPEQQVPDSVVNYPWESCITLGSNWYSTGDPAEKYKTVKEVVRLLINIVAKGGNLLLGVGPDKTGDLVPEVYSRLEEIGKWTKINGEGIYGTIPCFPYKNGPWCFTKSKSGKTVYAFLVPTTNETLTEKILFPKDLYLVKPAVYLLGYPKPLAVSVTGEGMWISVPKNVVRQFLTQPAWGFRIDKK
jgi:alpha-L-fucosidase